MRMEENLSLRKFCAIYGEKKRQFAVLFQENTLLKLAKEQWRLNELDGSSHIARVSCMTREQIYHTFSAAFLDIPKFISICRNSLFGPSHCDFLLARGSACSTTSEEPLTTWERSFFVSSILKGYTQGSGTGRVQLRYSIYEVTSVISANRSLPRYRQPRFRVLLRTSDGWFQKRKGVRKGSTKNVKNNDDPLEI